MSGRQEPQRAAAERRGLRAGEPLLGARDELAGQGAAALGPEGDVGREGELARAVARGAALATVDLDHLRVEVDRDRLLGVAPERAVEAVAGAPEAALDRLAERTPEALCKLQRRRRRRHPGNRAQRRRGRVGAQVLDMVKALAADELGLGQRHHELPARDAAAAALDRRRAELAREFGVDQLDESRPALELTDAGQAGVGGERLVVGAELDPSGPRVTVTAAHLLGDLHSLTVAGIATATIPVRPDGKPRIVARFSASETARGADPVPRLHPATHGCRSERVAPAAGPDDALKAQGQGQFPAALPPFEVLETGAPVSPPSPLFFAGRETSQPATSRR